MRCQTFRTVCFRARFVAVADCTDRIHTIDSSQIRRCRRQELVPRAAINDGIPPACSIRTSAFHLTDRLALRIGNLQGIAEIDDLELADDSLALAAQGVELGFRGLRQSEGLELRILSEVRVVENQFLHHGLVRLALGRLLGQNVRTLDLVNVIILAAQAPKNEGPVFDGAGLSDNIEALDGILQVEHHTLQERHSKIVEALIRRIAQQ